MSPAIFANRLRLVVYRIPNVRVDMESIERVLPT